MLVLFFVGWNDMKCVVSGSFNKFYQQIVGLVMQLRQAGIVVLSPASTGIAGVENGFVRLKSDPAGASVGHLLKSHLDAIDRSQALVVFNGPWEGHPYVGPSTAAEIGWAAARRVPIYCLFAPEDSGLLAMVTAVVPGELIIGHLLHHAASLREGKGINARA